MDPFSVKLAVGIREVRVSGGYDYISSKENWFPHGQVYVIRGNIVELWQEW